MARVLGVYRGGRHGGRLVGVGGKAQGGGKGFGVFFAGARRRVGPLRQRVAGISRGAGGMVSLELDLNGRILFT